MIIPILSGLLADVGRTQQTEVAMKLVKKTWVCPYCGSIIVNLKVCSNCGEIKK